MSSAPNTTPPAAWTLLVAGMLAAFFACRHEPPRTPLSAFDEETDRFLDPGFLDAHAVRSWRFESPEALAEWSAQNVDLRHEIEAGELVLRSSTEDPQIARDVELDAASVDTVRVSLTASAASPYAELYFARPGEGFSEDRKVLSERPARKPRALDFPVGGHPEWKGTISRLRIDPTTTPGATVRIGEIAALRHSIAPGTLEALAARTHRVDLGHEVRSALATPPGRIVTGALDVPRNATLRVGFGLWQPVGRPEPRPIAFRIRLEAPGKGDRILLEERLDPERDGGRWHDRAIDLGIGTTTTASVVLETDAVAIPGAPGALPVWSGLDLVVPDLAADAPPNLVLVSIDTLRADHLSLYGYSRLTSPELDAWARRSGVTFENAIAASPWTLPSHTSLFAGTNPTRHGVNYNHSAIPGDVALLAPILREAGWETAAFTGGVLLHPRYGFARGFDRYRHWPSWKAPRSEELRTHLDGALRFVEENAARPFFLFLHTYEVHTPYRAREPFFGEWSVSAPAQATVNFATPEVPAAENGFRVTKGLTWEDPAGEPGRAFTTEDLPVAVAMYDSGIRFADREVGRLLRKLEELGIAERTLVVVTSDHGELFGEHGEVGHYTLYEENLRVPLVFSLPAKIAGGRRIAQQVRTIDIPVTILALLGAPALPEPDGVDLSATLVGRHRPLGLEAWSYAPSTNYGVSLRRPDGLHFIYNNTVWPPRHGAEEIFGGAGATPEERERLRSVIRSELIAVPGYRVRIANREPQPLAGEIHGARAEAVKSVEPLPCPCLRWDESGRVAFEIPPRSEIAFSLEVLDGSRLEISGGIGGPEAAAADRFRLVAGEDPALEQSAVLEGAGWRIVERTFEDPMRTAISVRFEGRPPGRIEGDEDVADGLRALGYLQK